MASEIQRSLLRIYNDLRAKGLIKQESIVSATGISQGMVSLYLNGKTPIKDEDIELLCKAMGIPLRELFNQIDSDLPEEDPKIRKIKTLVDKIKTLADTLPDKKKEFILEELETVIFRTIRMAETLVEEAPKKK